MTAKWISSWDPALSAGAIAPDVQQAKPGPKDKSGRSKPGGHGASHGFAPRGDAKRVQSFARRGRGR